MSIETLWAITAAVVPTLLATGLSLIPTDGNEIGTRLCFIFASACLGVVGFMWLIHTSSPLFYRALAGVALGVAVFVVMPLLLRATWPLEAQRASEPSVGRGDAMKQKSVSDHSVITQGPGSAFSVGQRGGITAGTVNIAPTRMIFTNQLGAELLGKMRDKKRIELHTIGNDDDQSVGTKIQNFFSERGYPIERIIIGMMAPPPNGPITLSETPDHYLLIVAPSAR